MLKRGSLQNSLALGAFSCIIFFYCVYVSVFVQMWQNVLHVFFSGRIDKLNNLRNFGAEIDEPELTDNGLLW